MGSMSIAGAEGKLREAFKGARGDFLNIDMFLGNLGRSFTNPVDVRWFYNFITLLKKHDLAISQSGRKEGKSVTLGVLLTPHGREVVYAQRPIVMRDKEGLSVQSRSDTPVNPSKQSSRVSFVSVRADVNRLRAMYPEFNITFQVELKQEDN